VTEAANVPPVSLPNRPPWPSYAEDCGLEHVEYEFEMLDFTAYWIQQHAATADRPMRNAMLESYAMHVRALIDFLGLREGGNKKETDLKVSDFVNNFDEWNAAKGSLPPFDYKAEAIRTNERVAHLTKKRNDPAGKGWPLAIVAPLRQQEIVFFNHLKPELRSGAPRAMTTLVRVLVAPDLSTSSSSSSVSVRLSTAHSGS
jgi:hypothetical protein